MICKEVQLDLALAAAGTLNSARLLEVTQHCHQCAACAARLQEFQLIASAHSRAVADLNRLPLRYRASAVPRHHPARSPRPTASAPLWRWVLPLGTAVALLTFSLLLPWTPRPPIAPTPTPDAAKAPEFIAPQAPSLAAYRSAFNQAGEASLDALLNQHEKHLLPETPDPELRHLHGQL
jgi:anti-sigma factor RsiW